MPLLSARMGILGSSRNPHDDGLPGSHYGNTLLGTSIKPEDIPHLRQNPIASCLDVLGNWVPVIPRLDFLFVSRVVETVTWILQGGKAPHGCVFVNQSDTSLQQTVGHHCSDVGLIARIRESNR